MKTRSAEAARLEKDYLGRVRSALAGRDPAEIEDVLFSLHEHIEEELAQDRDEEVRLSRMAAVLERLGPPESYAPETPERPTAPSAPPPSDARGFAELLDRVWVAYFIAILGIYVPIIDVQLCGIVGGVVLAVVLLRTGNPELRSAGRLAAADVVLLLALGALGLATLAVRELALLALPVLVVHLACAILAYWKLMGATADTVLSAGHLRLGEALRRIRRGYVVYCVISFAVLLALGVVLGLVLDFRRGNPVWWVGYLFLPVGWFFGYHLVLSPLSSARAALSAPAPALPKGSVRASS